MSGARIVASLMHVLEVEDGRLGVAAISNGGGGGTAILIERPLNRQKKVTEL